MRNASDRLHLNSLGGLERGNKTVNSCEFLVDYSLLLHGPFLQETFLLKQAKGEQLEIGL